MAHRFNDYGRSFVVLDDDGYMSLYTADGHYIGANIFLRVQDHVDDTPSAIGKFAVNIVGTKEEMRSEIERLSKAHNEMLDRINGNSNTI